MNLLIVGRPGIRIYHELRKSETAWQALRFYNPLEIDIGIYIPLNSLSAALSLASDLKYFIRKYSTVHLFEISPGLFCTHAVVKSRYISRNKSFEDPWPWKLWFLINTEKKINRFYCYPSDEAINNPEEYKGGYIFEVWCLRDEYSGENNLIFNRYPEITE